MNNSGCDANQYYSLLASFVFQRECTILVPRQKIIMSHFRGYAQAKQVKIEGAERYYGDEI